MTAATTGIRDKKGRLALDTALVDLDSRDAKIRFKASAQIARLAAGNWTDERGEWLTDDSVLTPLFQSLEDSEVKVCVRSIFALGCISQRYEHETVEIKEALLAAHAAAPEGKPGDTIRIEVASSIVQFGGADVWNILLAAFECKPPRKARQQVSLALARYGERMPASQRKRFLPALMDAYHAEGNLGCRFTLAKAVKRVACDTAPEFLAKLLEVTKDAVLRDDIRYLMEKGDDEG